MNKRFWIICSVICLGLLTLSVLGLSSLKMHRKGLEAERQQEFMNVAKRISFDVKKKVDDFLQQEQNRPYTEYLPYYVPETMAQTINYSNTLVQSPLANAFDNGFATGYFELEPDGRITSPYLAGQQTQQSSLSSDHSAYFDNIRRNLLPSMQNGRTVATHRVEPAEQEKKDGYGFDKTLLSFNRRTRTAPREAALDESAKIVAKTPEKGVVEDMSQKKQVASKSEGSSKKRSVYPISNLNEAQQKVQVMNQSRYNYEQNIATNEAVQAEESASWAGQSGGVSKNQRPSVPTQQAPVPSSRPGRQSSYDFSQKAETERTDSDSTIQQDKGFDSTGMRERSERQMQQPLDEKKDNNLPAMTPGMMDPMMGDLEQPQAKPQSRPVEQSQMQQTDTVQVRIEPFVPVTVPDSTGGNGIFAGQVYLLRHVQIEDRHIVQGFQLNEDELLTQVADSAKKLLGRGMGYELSKKERSDAAFTAILQFDFGEVVLNLLEQNPGYIQAQVLRIRNWFFGILAVVWLAVVAAMAALWKNLHEQVALSRKKDDFISAVSHELRTPLTSIRMYTEMLEKDWVKTDAKRREYYTTMRTESERLTRLIENVLDFSRIQRGKKRYDFTVGDVNECIGKVADTMRPYVERAGFVLEQRFEVLPAFAFDRDAVMQIVINLLDNALKYAKDAQDKHIIVRTRKQKDYVIIEVEDHGPGISRSQEKKIFDAFYRCEDESTRQSTGTGLGLALVKRFAEAHHGFVEILNAKPTGACFRVWLTCAS
jgi:signal transduction histidine kinase